MLIEQDLCVPRHCSTQRIEVEGFRVDYVSQVIQTSYNCRPELTRDRATRESNVSWEQQCLKLAQENYSQHEDVPLPHFCTLAHFVREYSPDEISTVRQVYHGVLRLWAWDQYPEVDPPGLSGEQFATQTRL